MNAIPGPYKFGDHPPTHLMGWLPTEVQHAIATCPKTQLPFQLNGPPSPQPPPPIWTYTKQLTGGHHLPTFEQLIGDCVAAGLSQAGSRLQVAEIARQYQEELLKPWFVPYIYGISRVQIGGGQLDGDGSTGTWGAAAVNRYGVLFTTDPNVPHYTAQIARQWGNPPGPPPSHISQAEDNPVRTTARITTVDQIRDALCSYYPVTIASSRGFRMEPTNRDGFHVFVPSGSWMHQMCLIAWMDEPFPAAYRLNSWGPNAHGSPLHDEPPGGAWCTADCIANELHTPNTEVYAYSNFDGFPSPPNLAPIK